MKSNLLVSLLLFLILAASTSYAVASGSALQVSGYTTVPTSVYPGTTDQLKLTIENSGSDTATGVTLYYSYGVQSDNAYTNVGDISAGSSAIVTIPFKVPNSVNGGVLVIPIRIDYSDSTGKNNKESPVSIPIPIAQHQILEVKTISLSKQTVQAGEKVTAQLEIINSGGRMDNVVITTPDNSSFTLAGINQQSIGEIASNTSKTVSVNLISSSLTASGKYTIPIVVSYQDALQNTVSQTVYIGPVTVSDSSTQFRIDLVPVTSTEIGSEAEFRLTLENTGESATSAIIDLNQSSVFTPIGVSRIYFDYIGSGENATKIVKLGIGATALAGYYNLPLTITANGKTYVQNIGVPVQATSELAITSDTQPQFVTAGTNGVKVLVQIANVGNTPIRSVYASTQSTDGFNVVGASDKLVGTLNIDDFTTFQFTINVRNQAVPGKYTIPVTINFKDSENKPHTVIKDVAIEVYSSDMATRFNDAATAGAMTNGAAGAARRNGGVLFGFSWLQIILVMVVLAGAYFGYKKWKAGKKPATTPKQQNDSN